MIGKFFFLNTNSPGFPIKTIQAFIGAQHVASRKCSNYFFSSLLRPWRFGAEVWGSRSLGWKRLESAQRYAPRSVTRSHSTCPRNVLRFILSVPYLEQGILSIFRLRGVWQTVILWSSPVRSRSRNESQFCLINLPFWLRLLSS